MSLQRQILSPVTTAGLLYPALHQNLYITDKDSELVVQIAMPNMVSRSFLQNYSLTASNSITFPKQSGSPAAVLQRVAEGSEIPLDVTSYSSVNAVPYAVKHGYSCPSENMNRNYNHEGNHRKLRAKTMLTTSYKCLFCDKTFENAHTKAGHIRSHKVNSSEIMKAVWKRKETREKQKENLHKIQQAEGYWERVSQGLKRHWKNNDKRRQEHSERMKKEWANPESKRRITFASKEFRDKLSEVGLKVWQRPEHRIKESEAHKEWWNNLTEEEKTQKLENWTLKSKTHRKRTQIEQMMLKALQNEGLEKDLQTQFRISSRTCPYYIDLAYPNEKILIECYGDYWHANPLIYSTLDKIQTACVQRDKKKLQNLKEHGFIVLTFYETDIRKNIKSCVEIIKQHLPLNWCQIPSYPCNKTS